MIHVDRDVGDNPEKIPDDLARELREKLESVSRPVVAQDELPSGYVVPTDFESVKKIYSIDNKFGSKEYPEVLRRYACEAWRVCGGSFSKACQRLGVSMGVLKKWVSHYLPHELAKKRAQEIESANHIDLTELEIEKELRRVLRKARKQIDNASYSQLMIGFGIMVDKLEKLKRLPKSRDKSEHMEVLKGLPSWALERIMSIIEECKSGRKTEAIDAEFTVRRIEDGNGGGAKSDGG